MHYSRLPNSYHHTHQLRHRFPTGPVKFNLWFPEIINPSIQTNPLHFICMLSHFLTNSNFPTLLYLRTNSLFPSLFLSLLPSLNIFSPTSSAYFSKHLLSDPPFTAFFSLQTRTLHTNSNF